MSVGSRFWNFVKGLFWQGQRNLEKANPEAVYEMAIRKMKSNYQEMQTAVGRLAAERNRLRAVIQRKGKQLAEVETDLQGALNEAEAGNNDALEIGEELIVEKEALESELSTLRQELAQSEDLVGSYKEKLRSIEGKTKEMESRRDAMLAKLQSAQARKAFADMVSGMATTAEESAVSDIDKYIEGVAAQADIADEMSGATREERRRKLRQQARERTSQSKFQAMLEARKGGGGTGSQAKATEKAGIG